MSGERVVFLKNVRIVYPEVYKAVQYQGSGPYSYKAAFLIEPDSENDKALRNAISIAARGAWADKAADVMASIKGRPKEFCYTEGKLKKNANFAKYWYLSASRREKDGPPRVVSNVAGKDGRPATLEASSGLPYGGCYVNAKVEIWAQHKTDNAMRCSLIAVQFAGHGDAFGGAAPADDDGLESIESAPTESHSDLM